MILADHEITELCSSPNPMIMPYSSVLVRHMESKAVLSWGQGSYGYDIRVGAEVTLLDRSPLGGVNDPKNHQGDNFRSFKAERPWLLAPGVYALMPSVERFHMPADIVAIALGKSSYARVGVAVNVTPLEPGWSGYLTIEIFNASNTPVWIYPNEGIAQLIFFRGAPPLTTYETRPGGAGKYQNQLRTEVHSKP